MVYPPCLQCSSVLISFLSLLVAVAVSMSPDIDTWYQDYNTMYSSSIPCTRTLVESIDEKVGD